MRLTPSDLAPWCEYRFDTSGGPGGQHVNKVSTRATLLFDYAHCTLLSEFQRARLAARLHSRFSSDGRIRVVAQQDRSQSANRAAAAERLVELLTAALAVPRTRVATRPSRAAKRRRIVQKRQRGETKRWRSGGAGGDE